MQRREFITSLAAMSALPLVSSATESVSPPARSPFTMRGVYFHDGFTVEPKSHAPLYWTFADWKKQLDWLHACGINTVEFATMLEFNRVPATAMEERKVADKQAILKYAHSLGMKFGYLLTNTVVSTVPANEEPGNQLKARAVALCPREPGNFEKTMAVSRYYMKAFRDADFFEQFAADWGGCDCGRCDVSDYLKYVRTMADELTTLKSKARLYANTWCISFWRKDPMRDGWKGVFDREISGTKEVIEGLRGMPRHVHMGLPCHHLYRPLAFSSYGSRAATPEFPAKADRELLKQDGREMLAWTHFVMDDDPFRPQAWGIVHSELRYIQALLKRLRDSGIDRVVGNLYLPRLQISNTYAWGKLLQNPDASIKKIMREFASLVAHKEDVDKLVSVMTWLENNSFWQKQMPRDGVLPNLPCDLSKATAAKLAAEIKPNASPELPLPIAPVDWLTDLHRSIGRMEWAV